MNSFRPLVYLTVGEDATGVFCRDSGLVQGLLSTGTAVHRWRQRYAVLLREGIAATGSRSGGSGRRDPVSAGGPGTGVTFSTDCFIAVRRPKDDRRGRRAGRREPRAARSGRRAVKGCLSTI